MSYRIVDYWLGGKPITAAGPDLARGFAVYADAADQPCLITHFGVRQRLALDLFPLKSGGRTSLDEPRLARALAMHALPRIEAGLLDGAFAKYMGSQFNEFLTTPEEARRLPALLNEKLCRYLQHGDDDLCRAGYDERNGDKKPIATTAHLCRLCEMPDSRVACSKLHHVTTWPKDRGIQPTGAMCAAGEKENPNAAECRPGGNECWHRLVEPHVREDIVRLSPLTLHEAIGYLDTVWLNIFREGLLARDVLLAGGTLATPCTGSQDFRDKLSAAVDAFDAFQVPGSRGGTLERMTAYLKDMANRMGVLQEFAPVEQAISVLQKVPRLRAGFQHGDERARRDFEEAQQVLGVRLPAVSYAEEWSRLVARVAGQLAIVREFLRKHAGEAGSRPPAPAP